MAIAKRCRHFTDKEKTDKLALIVAPVSGVRAITTDTSTVTDERPAPIRTDLFLYATILSPTSTVTHTFVSKGGSAAQPGSDSTGTGGSGGGNVAGEARRAYIHVVQSSGFNPGKAVGGRRVQVNGGGGGVGGGVVLAEGDGVYAWGNEGEKLEFQNIGDGDVEFLVFDIA